MQREKKISKKDILLIISILLVAAIAWFVVTSLLFPGQPYEEEHVPHGEIYLGGFMIKSVPLNVDQVFSVAERPGVVFEVRDGAIAFIESNCPDQVCVHAGFLSSPWHFAACLPNLLLLSVQGEIPPRDGGSDIDTSVR